MIDISKIKALAFDFGGTLDSPFLHWMKVYLQVYNDKLGLSLDATTFRDSYVYAEREMERLQLVNHEDNLLQTQLYKTRLQFESLCWSGIIADTEYNRTILADKAAHEVTDYSSSFIAKSRLVLERLSVAYPLLLVSNYYGNIKAITESFDIAKFFKTITDSTIAGVRKPDPELWAIAFRGAGFMPEEMLVVGDSTKNDIKPALSLGCQVVKCCATDDDVIDGISCITSINQLPALLSL